MLASQRRPIGATLQPKKLLKDGRRRPFISIMNAAMTAKTTATATDRHYVVDQTSGEWKVRRSTFTYLPGNVETCGNLTKEEAEDLAYDMYLLDL